MKNSEKIYWMKVGGALLIAIITTILNTYVGLEGTTVFFLGITLYVMLSEALAIFVNMNRNRTFRIGIGAFIFIWIMIWTLLNTILKT
jgi:hypothetical protein